MEAKDDKLRCAACGKTVPAMPRCGECGAEMTLAEVPTPTEEKKDPVRNIVTAVLAIVALLLFFFAFSDNEPSKSDLRRDAVIKAVQEAESKSGTPLLQYITGKVAARQAKGHVYKIEGWDLTQEFSNKWGGVIYNVYLTMYEDGQELEFHWIVHEETSTLHPFSEYAKKVSDKQKVVF